MKQYLMFEQNPVFDLRDNMQIVKFDISKCTCGIKKVKVTKINTFECRKLASPTTI